jgi:hypothetical protein
MKKILLACTLVAFSIASWAQNEPTKDIAAKTGAIIEFESTTVEYGVVEYGSDPHRIVKFKNVGDEPLIIKSAKGSCGCTVPTYPKEPILPGESGEFKVRYETTRVGPISKSITVLTNAKEENVTLLVRGEVKPKEDAPAGLPTRESNSFNKGN